MNTNSEINVTPTAAAADPPATSLVDRTDVGAAYQRRLPEILAVPDEQIVRVTVDVNAAAATVIGTMKKIAPFRAAIAKLPDIDQALVDGLEDYALAAEEADARYLTAGLPHEDIVALNNEALDLRDMVKMDVAALVRRGLIDSARLNAFKGSTGYKNVAHELIEYAVLLTEHWSKIQGKTGLSESEVQHVKELGSRLLRAAGEREQSPIVVAETADIRRRAVTRMLQSYDEVRRALSFIRWKEGDVETIAPSLFSGRGGRGGPVATNGDTTQPGGTPAAVSAPVAPVASATPSAAPVPVGFPGSSPFLTSK